MKKLNAILGRLKALADPCAVEGMARYGINPKKAFGVSIPDLRKIAKETGPDHRLALKLWKAGYRETMILASMIEIPEIITETQMEEWVQEFDYWEICDQCCMNLFEKTELAFIKAVQWSSSQKEFIKRAGFVLMARLAVSDKKAKDSQFEKFFPVIENESVDNRNYVKKAVNWALRQIGKRNLNLNKKACNTARKIHRIDSASAQWIASDALRELSSEQVVERLKKKNV